MGWKSLKALILRATLCGAYKICSKKIRCINYYATFSVFSMAFKPLKWIVTEHDAQSLCKIVNQDHQRLRKMVKLVNIGKQVNVGKLVDVVKLVNLVKLVNVGIAELTTYPPIRAT